MSSAPLSYNQYAAKALWGGSSGSSSSYLLDIIKANMLDKANSANKTLMSRYETYVSEISNKISYFDNLKSKLTTLSTKAHNLTELKNRVNANINVSQGNSSLVTITNDFIIKKGQTAGVTSMDTSAVTVGNYEGTFAAGDYTINVTGNPVTAQSNDIDMEKIKFSASQLGSQKIFELAGYKNPSNAETVTVYVSNSASHVTVNRDTTVSGFLQQLSGIDGIERASIDSNGQISIEMDTSLGYKGLSFSSSNTSGGSVIDVLGLTSATSALNNGTIDTLNFQGFYRNLEDLGLTGSLNLNIDNTTFSGYINNSSVYGNEYTLTPSTNGEGVNLKINNDNITLTTSIDTIMKCKDDAYSMAPSFSFNNNNFGKYYDTNNYSIKADISNIMNNQVQVGKLFQVVKSNGQTYSYQAQDGDTVRSVLTELEISINDDNTINIKNLSSVNSYFLLMVSDLSAEVTISAKTGDDAPPQLSNKLVDYSYDNDPNHKITTGDLSINIDGVEKSFTIGEDTTVDAFLIFMKGLRFDYDFSTKNFVGGPSGSNISVSGTNSITSIIKPVVSEYKFQVGIEDDGAGNYYKNLSALGFMQNDTISINGTSIDIKAGGTIAHLLNTINNTNAGVEASLSQEENGKLKINLARTDGYLSYIEFGAVDGYSQSLLYNLGFITSYTGSYSINTEKQTLPNNVSITVKDKDGNVYDIGNITSSDVVNNSVSFSTTVNNTEASGSFNITINKLGEHTVTVTAAVPDITVSNLSGATNYIEMVEKTGNLSSNIYNLQIKKTSETQMQISVTDNNGNAIEPQTVEKDANDNKFYYTITQYDENGDEKGSVKFEIKNDENFAVDDTRETKINIEAMSMDQNFLDGINTMADNINKQIDENNKKIINEFVNAYNDVVKEVSKINQLSSTSTSFMDKLAISELMKSFDDVINQVDTTHGSLIGLTFEYDKDLNASILKLDTDKFFTALDNDTENVSNYLSTISETIISSIDLFLKGQFESIHSSSKSKLDEYNNKISSLKDQNDKLMAKLEADYKIIEQLFNQSSNQYSELYAPLS